MPQLSTRRQALSVAVRAAACLPLGAGCTGPAASGAGGSEDLLYVMDAAHGTASLVDGRAGRTIGVPVALGIGSSLGISFPDGSALVASGETDPYCATRMTRLFPHSREGAGVNWRRPFQEGACISGLAAGGDVALIAYALNHARRESSYELTIVSAADGVVLSRQGIGGTRDLLTGIALRSRGSAPLVYATFWTAARFDDDLFSDRPGDAWYAPRAASAPQHEPATARIEIIDPLTGRRLATAELSGLPRPFVLGGSTFLAGPAFDPAAVCVITSHPGTTWGQWNELEHAFHFGQSSRWVVTRYDAATLAPLDQADLTHAPLWLALSPDGAYAYMTDALGSAPTGSLVSCLDLSLMTATSLGHVPAGRPGGIAATADSLYISDPRRGVVWASEREGGAPYRAFRAGDAPSTLCAVTVV